MTRLSSLLITGIAWGILTAGNAFAMGTIPNIDLTGLANIPSYIGVPYAPTTREDYQISASQINATQEVAVSANYGSGVTIGIVDSGIEVNNPAFAGRISSESACVTQACIQGYDTGGLSDAAGGHGTFVATVAAGAPGGIAPWTNIAVMRVESNGSIGSDAIDAGIRKAADAGAAVINISVNGAINSIDAINYAASKGATVVIAAGVGAGFLDLSGSSAPFSAGFFRDTTGFTPEALKHLIIVGGVTSSNTLQGNSNYPSDGVIGTSPYNAQYVQDYTQPDGSCPCGGHFVLIITGPTTPYSSLWLVAPSLYTSYAAPQVTGAIALLDARWPVLQRNGTTAQVLFDTAMPLGDPSIYGNGLLNVAQAFQPIGRLMIPTDGGQLVTVKQVAYIIHNGVLGSLGSLASHLSNMTAFDSFQRDFQINLSGGIARQSAALPALSAATAPKPTVSATKFADGSSLAFGTMENTSNGIDHPLGEAGNRNWFLSFNDASGATVAAGYGFPASASFADVLWGGDNSIGSQAAELGVSSALMNLAEGGPFLALGNRIGKSTRLAFSWSQTQTPDPIANSGWAAHDSNAFNAGLSTHMTSYWMAGASLGMLDEKNGLLGSTYDPNGLLNFGAQHRSVSMSVSSAFNLSDKSDLLLEATMVHSDGGNGSGSSLISNVSALNARSFGASLVDRDNFNDGDRIQLSVKSPLRAISGSAGLMTTSVDSNGDPTTTVHRISLRPTGNEADFAVSYQAPLRDNLEWNVSFEGRHDADNIAGASDLIGIVGAKLTF